MKTLDSLIQTRILRMSKKNVFANIYIYISKYLSMTKSTKAYIPYFYIPLAEVPVNSGFLGDYPHTNHLLIQTQRLPAGISAGTQIKFITYLQFDIRKRIKKILLAQRQYRKSRKFSCLDRAFVDASTTAHQTCIRHLISLSSD